VAAQATAGLTAAYQITDKQDRQAAVGETKAAVIEALASGDDAQYSADDVKGALYKLEKKIVRGRIIAGQPRIDGRDVATVRGIDVQVGVLPRTHGSAIFTRGETQAIVVTTLGTGRDAQIIDAIEGSLQGVLSFCVQIVPVQKG
jgi:polyribonucleotide nucleotidyltransferase